MFFEWIAREGGAILSWWLLAWLAGAAVYPLFFRLMRGLPSRGYPLARAAGLMLVGFVFWLLNNLGLLANNPGSTMVAWLIVLIAGLVSYLTWSEREPVLPWLRRNRSLILTTEVLFAALFVGWVVMRALNHDITGTEKPMEMAFLSAIRRSATFPPHDPWMSGYAISYYHFGYIIMAMLANLSGVTNGMAFNLAVPLLFGLAGVGIFGVAYDLVLARILHRFDQHRARRGEDAEDAPPRRWPAVAAGLLSVFFLLFMGNFGMVMVEVPYQAGSTPAWYLDWVDMLHRPSSLKNCPPSNSLNPEDWCYMWWWADSRVVLDRNLDGGSNEIIDEFPQFSFILSDMHPHVLALPFGLLAIGLALNLVLQKRRTRPWEMLLYGVYIGGMIFLNSWDAVYLGLFIGAEALRRLMVNATGKYTREDWRGLLVFGGSLLGLTALLYAPFFIGFRSQAGGPLPNVIWPTRFQQYFEMFGPFLIILGIFLAVEVWRAGPRFNVRFGLQIIGSVIAFLIVVAVLLAGLAWAVPDIRGIVYKIFDQSGGLVSIIPEILLRRLRDSLTTAVLLLGLFVVIARLFAQEPQEADGTPAQADQIITYSPSTGFTLLLIAAGAVLTLAPEFVYLRDGFGTRINSIFKFYYQGWTLWSVAGAYAAWSVLAEGAQTEPGKRKVGDEAESLLPVALRRGFGVVLALLILAGSLYPVAAIPTRALKEGGHVGSYQGTITLEGGPSMVQSVDEYKVIQCLASVAHSDKDVVAEATRRGLAYNAAYGRVSALTGIPTLLGWDNHENQWRGSTFEDALTMTYIQDGQQVVENRYDAIANLYNTASVDQAWDIIKRYGITYIFVGPTERRDFTAAGLEKFTALPPVCASGDVAVYAADSLGNDNGSVSLK